MTESGRKANVVVVVFTSHSQKYCLQSGVMLLPTTRGQSHMIIFIQPITALRGGAT